MASAAERRGASEALLHELSPVRPSHTLTGSAPTGWMQIASAPQCPPGSSLGAQGVAKNRLGLLLRQRDFLSLGVRSAKLQVAGKSGPVGGMGWAHTAVLEVGSVRGPWHVDCGVCFMRGVHSLWCVCVVWVV